MKNYLTIKTLKALLFILAFSTSKYSLAQCPLTYYAGVGAPSTGTTFVTWANFGPGQYFAFPVLNGGSYAVSTCGASIDTQLTGWDSSASSTVFYNDNNGPLCTGVAASVDNYVPNFTNYAYVQVTQFNCSVGGSSSINLYFRQNNNLLFTSSSASMCSGQTRTLTATPAPVASTPGGYGNVGTFSGTGVSANVFTAPTVTAPTNFTLTYTFGYVTQTQVITVNPSPTITIGNYNICSGNSVTLSPSGATTYTFTGGGPVVSPAATTSYSITGTSAAGCPATNTAVTTISVNATPTIAVASGNICAGNSFVIAPSGASTYTVQGGTFTVSPGSTTSYTVSGTSAAGCLAASPATCLVVVNALPVLTVNATPAAVCQGGTLALTASGAATYTWVNSISNGVPFTPSATSAYSVVGTSSAGCTSSMVITTVSVNPNPTITALMSDSVICAGKTITLSATGADTYSWSNSVSGATQTLIAVNNSTYSVVGTNSVTGCSGNSGSVSVIVLPNPTVGIAASGTQICVGESATLTASGAFSYSWNTGAGTATIVVSPSVTTTYSTIGTNTNGCNSGVTYTLTVDPCTAIGKLGEVEAIMIYPNPNNGEFTIRTDNHAELSVYDNAGRAVRYIKLDENSGRTISVKGLANGVYYLSGRVDGKPYSAKVVVSE